jgi:hypothetical protein
MKSKRDLQTISSASPEPVPNENSQRRLGTKEERRDRSIVTPPQEECLPNSNTRLEESIPAEKTTTQVRLVLASCQLPGKSCLQVVTFERPSRVLNPTSSFAEIVNQMVSDVDSTDPSVIHWVLNGEAFHVEATHPCLGIALSKYFQRMCWSLL